MSTIISLRTRKLGNKSGHSIDIIFLRLHGRSAFIKLLKTSFSKKISKTYINKVPISWHKPLASFKLGMEKPFQLSKFVNWIVINNEIYYRKQYAKIESITLQLSSF